MSYTQLSPSGLRFSAPGDTDWNSQNSYNWTRLNDTLLKLSALLDVEDAGLADGDILRYSSSSSKWECEASPGGYRELITTTTTTTTTSTTTTTTTTV